MTGQKRQTRPPSIVPRIGCRIFTGIVRGVTSQLPISTTTALLPLSPLIGLPLNRVRRCILTKRVGGGSGCEATFPLSYYISHQTITLLAAAAVILQRHKPLQCASTLARK